MSNMNGKAGGLGWGAPWAAVDNGGGNVQAGNLAAGNNAPNGHDAQSLGNSSFIPNGKRDGRLLDTSPGGRFGVAEFLGRYYDAPFEGSSGASLLRGSSTLASSFGLADMAAMCVAVFLAWLAEENRRLVWLLPAGALPPNPQELLSRTAFALVLKELQKEYDVVLIDTPPAKLYADVQSIAFRAGVALVVARRNFTRVADASDVVRGLSDSGVRVVGTVMNAF